MTEIQAWEWVRARYREGMGHVNWLCYTVGTVPAGRVIRDAMRRRIADHWPLSFMRGRIARPVWPVTNPHWSRKVRIAFCNRMIRELSECST